MALFETGVCLNIHRKCLSSLTDGSSSSFYLALEFNSVKGRVVLMQRMRTWCKQQVISAAGDFYVFLMVGRLDNWRRCRTQLTRD